MRSMESSYCIRKPMRLHSTPLVIRSSLCFSARFKLSLLLDSALLCVKIVPSFSHFWEASTDEPVAGQLNCCAATKRDLADTMRRRNAIMPRRDTNCLRSVRLCSLCLRFGLHTGTFAHLRERLQCTQSLISFLQNFSGFFLIQKNFGCHVSQAQTPCCSAQHLGRICHSRGQVLATQ